MGKHVFDVRDKNYGRQNKVTETTTKAIISNLDVVFDIMVAMVVTMVMSVATVVTCW